MHRLRLLAASPRRSFLEVRKRRPVSVLSGVANQLVWLNKRPHHRQRRNMQMRREPERGYRDARLFSIRAVRLMSSEVLSSETGERIWATCAPSSTAARRNSAASPTSADSHRSPNLFPRSNCSPYSGGCLQGMGRGEQRDRLVRQHGAGGEGHGTKVKVLRGGVHGACQVGDIAAD